jgi:hypothetical protein
MPKHVFDPPDMLPVLIDPKGGKTPFVLAADLEYRSDIVCVTVEKGFKYDMASVPRFAWPFIPNTDPRIVRAATVHDKLYRTAACDRPIADGIFLSIMKHDRMPAPKRWAAYLAVRLFGGRNFGGGETAAADA